jgi:hypothetical protein
MPSCTVWCSQKIEPIQLSSQFVYRISDTTTATELYTSRIMIVMARSVSSWELEIRFLAAILSSFFCCCYSIFHFSSGHTSGMMGKLVFVSQKQISILFESISQVLGANSPWANGGRTSSNGTWLRKGNSLLLSCDHCIALSLSPPGPLAFAFTQPTIRSFPTWVVTVLLGDFGI